MTGAQAASTSGSATAFSTTSRPMPAGSPIVTATRGRRAAAPSPAGTVGCCGASLIARSLNQREAKRGERVASARACGRASVARLAAAVAVFGLEHVFDVVFEEHDVGRALAVDLQGVAVVPLDGALDLLAVREHDDHQRVPVHLLLVIKNLGVGLGGRNLLASQSRCRRRGRVVA